MIRAQRSTGLIALGFTIFLSNLPVYAQRIRTTSTADARDPGGAATRPQQSSTPARPITLSEAVSIFLKQNFQLIAARYDIDTADAEKLTARLRPNPDISVGFSGLPLNLSGNLLTEQQ